MVGVRRMPRRRTRSRWPSASTSMWVTPSVRAATSASTCRVVRQGAQNAEENWSRVARSPRWSPTACRRGRGSCGRSRHARRRGASRLNLGMPVGAAEPAVGGGPVEAEPHRGDDRHHDDPGTPCSRGPQPSASVDRIPALRTNCYRRETSRFRIVFGHATGGAMRPSVVSAASVWRRRGGQRGDAAPTSGTGRRRSCPRSRAGRGPAGDARGSIVRDRLLRPWPATATPTRLSGDPVTGPSTPAAMPRRPRGRPDRRRRARRSERLAPGSSRTRPCSGSGRCGPSWPAGTAGRSGSASGPHPQARDGSAPRRGAGRRVVRNEPAQRRPGRRGAVERLPAAAALTSSGPTCRIGWVRRSRARTHDRKVTIRLGARRPPSAEISSTGHRARPRSAARERAAGTRPRRRVDLDVVGGARCRRAGRRRARSRRTAPAASRVPGCSATAWRRTSARVSGPVTGR